MTNSTSKVAACLALLALITTQSGIAEQSLPSGVTQWGLITVGRHDYYIPIPSDYPAEAAGQKIGPDNAWFKAFWIPKGQTTSNWIETMSLLILPGNAPAIEIMSAQLSQTCPKNFFKRPVDPPQFIVAQDSTSAVVMGCGSTEETSSIAFHGYYVAVHTKDYNYLLSREIRATATSTVVPLQAETLANWQRAFEKFAVCDKGTFCAKLKRSG